MKNRCRLLHSGRSAIRIDWIFPDWILSPDCFCLPISRAYHRLAVIHENNRISAHHGTLSKQIPIQVLAHISTGVPSGFSSAAPLELPLLFQMFLILLVHSLHLFLPHWMCSDNLHQAHWTYPL